MSRFLKEKYKSLKEYTPGEQPKGREYVKLNTNESPFPPSPLAVSLAEEAARRLMLYPDPNVTDLTGLMADELGVSADGVIMTNGSDEVLNFAFMAWCDENCPAVFADITYGFYRVFADINNLPYRQIPLKDDFSLDLDRLAAERGTLFIANPNAPTGIAISLSEIEELLLSDRNRIVVIDEAYVDFGTESAVRLIDKYDNLFVTGTFSKSRSMAGARLGYGAGSPALVSDLVKIKYSTNPYNVNRMTAAAGEGALRDKAYFENNCRAIIENRAWLEKELASLNFVFTPSKANFIFAKSDRISGEQLYLRLKEKGVLVRHFNGARISEFNRITIGNSEQMQILVDKIKEIFVEIDASVADA